MQWLPPYTRNQNTVIQRYSIAVHNREEDTMTYHESERRLFDLTELHPSYHYTINVAAVTNVVGPDATIQIITLEDGEKTNHHDWIVLMQTITLSRVTQPSCIFNSCCVSFQCVSMYILIQSFEYTCM